MLHIYFVLACTSSGKIYLAMC